MDGFEFAVGDVGIDLSGRDIGVTEEELDGAEVGAVAQEIGGEAVAESMRGDGLHDARGDRVALDDSLHTPRGDPTLFIIHEHWLTHILSLVQITFQRLLRLRREEDDAHLAALAADAELLALQVHALTIKIAELGDPEAGGEEEFEDGAVAAAEGSGCVGLLQEALELFGTN